MPPSSSSARVTRSVVAALLLAGSLAACRGGTTDLTTTAPVPVTPPASDPAAPTAGGVPSGPPEATPLAEQPREPEGSGATVTLRTAAGEIVIELFDRSAPVASANFVQLAESGFYEGVVFHRIVPGFMIQGGDPTGTGRGGPGYTIQDEPFAGEYVPGVVAMARTQEPDSQGSQFFIVIGDASHLEHTYTIFGRVTSGLEVAEAIAAGPRGGPSGDQALEPVAVEEAIVQRP